MGVQAERLKTVVGEVEVRCLLARVVVVGVLTMRVEGAQEVRLMLVMVEAPVLWTASPVVVMSREVREARPRGALWEVTVAPGQVLGPPVLLTGVEEEQDHDSAAAGGRSFVQRMLEARRTCVRVLSALRARSSAGAAEVEAPGRREHARVCQRRVAAEVLGILVWAARNFGLRRVNQPFQTFLVREVVAVQRRLFELQEVEEAPWILLH